MLCLQITAGIPAKVAQVQEQEQRARELVAIAKRRADRSAIIAATMTAASGVIAGSLVAGIVFPPALLILPVLLPILGLISGATNVHYSRKAESKSYQIIKFLC